MFRKLFAACFALAAVTAIALAVVVSEAAPAASGRTIAGVCNRCNPACAAGWHCCTTASGYCSCFLDAQGPCP